MFLYVEGGFHYHQYVLLPGQTRRFIAIAGQTLARFHQALKDFSPLGFNPDGFRSQRGDRGRGVQWALDKLGRCLQTSSCQSPDADRDRVAQLLMEARSVQESLLRLDTALKQAALPRLVIHGDYGPYNLLFRKDAPVVVLDWEMARLSWRVTDLVYACFRFGCDTLGFRVSKVKWLLDAYQAHFPLTEDERRFLPAVWAFLNLWQCILNWDCYCETKAGSYLDKALWHLKAVDWMRANKDRLL